MATIRTHILRNPSRLRDVIGKKEFVDIFGPAKPHKKGERQNIFGGDDMLKVAPKGIDKTHPDIDLLKLRSIAVVHRFMDSEVTDPAFMDSICTMIVLMRPLVHLLNEMVTIPPDSENEES
ncbi:hypothetical protein FRB94_006668 [Tulasnella sp. JGI-2019a]|nr:hypothetical protein FRB93_006433 [Tulasnella sp. JGI-2019a]KAG8998778.1 hypothetical protein FRB94_006668 [Tulasnella sp. JGI-2019a]